MAASAPHSPVFAHGYPAALNDLRAQATRAEPELVLGLCGLLRAAGMTITLAEADVLSGHAGQLFYDRMHPECAQLAFVPPVETLFRALHVTWKEVTPSGPDIAFVVLQDWLQAGSPAIARLKEPLLVYGCDRSERDSSIIAARLGARLADVRLSVRECEQHYWRIPLDEGNLLLRIESAPPRIENLNGLIHTAVRRTVRAWHAAELAGCAAGSAAYRALAADLANDHIDFTRTEMQPWLTGALWRQWTARGSLHEFFLRTAPRFGGSERAALEKAAFCYGQCVDAWRKWADYLGPTWNFAQRGFEVELPREFLDRWRSRPHRMHAARWVEEARGWEEKAVRELTKTIR